MKFSSINYLFTSSVLFSSALLASAEETQNIVEVASSLSAFSTLIELAGTIQPIVDRLTGDTPTTLFAPTDEAFDALPMSTTLYLTENPDVLTEVLLYHAVDGSITSDAIDTEPLIVPTLLEGAEVTAQIIYHGIWCWFGFCSQDIVINDSLVVAADVQASNGIIHAIDKVLVPPDIVLLDIVDIAIANELHTLVAAVIAADLVDVLRAPGPYTVFAPSEAAWSKLPAGFLQTLLLPENIDLLSTILQYHVVSGQVLDSKSLPFGSSIETVSGDSLGIQLIESEVLVGDVTVVAADFSAINGIVHVISDVLIPPDINIPMDIVELARSDPDLTMLVDALVEANLVGILDSPGPFTILAPTDTAFLALGDVSLDKKTLRNILRYHVIQGKFAAETIVTLESAPTLNGQSVAIRVDGEMVFVNDAQVVATDIEASNGIIHTIDRVLIPPEQEEKKCPYFSFICTLFPWLYV